MSEHLKAPHNPPPVGDLCSDLQRDSLRIVNREHKLIGYAISAIYEDEDGAWYARRYSNCPSRWALAAVVSAHGQSLLTPVEEDEGE